jgi:hypothetical protein
MTRGSSGRWCANGLVLRQAPVRQRLPKWGTSLRNLPYRYCHVRELARPSLQLALCALKTFVCLRFDEAAAYQARTLPVSTCTNRDAA